MQALVSVRNASRQHVAELSESSDQSLGFNSDINHGIIPGRITSCEVGLKSLFVRPNGTIYLGNCLVNGKIGNITKPDKIMWPTEPVKCNLDICSCSSDVNINKWID